MLVLGHRGAPRLAPENTLPAFAVALASGADGVELDVRLTADESLAVRHDDAFASGQRLSGLALGAARAVEPDIPTLAEALDVLAGGLCVVEMKTQPGRNERFGDLVADELERRSRQKLIVSSFDPTLLRGMRARLPSLRTALLVGVVAGPEQVEATVEEAVDAGHRQLHVERRILLGHLGGSLFERAADARIQVVAWTVNDPEDAQRLREQGLAAVITDVPDEMVRARNGQGA